MGTKHDDEPPPVAGSRPPGAAADVDTLLEREVERAIAPYRKVLSARALEDMADSLRDAFMTHPVMRAAFARVQPEPVVAKSDVVETDAHGHSVDKPAAQPTATVVKLKGTK